MSNRTKWRIAFGIAAICVAIGGNFWMEAIYQPSMPSHLLGLMVGSWLSMVVLLILAACFYQPDGPKY